MKVTAIPAGIYDANCYIISDENTKEAIVLDPGGDGEMILNQITKEGVKVKYILLTHGHADHVGAVDFLAKNLKVSVYLSEEDQKFIEKDTSIFGSIKTNLNTIKEGDKFDFGNLTLKVIETPGHTKGGVSFVTCDSIFTGDTLFKGSIGRTDFAGGDFDTEISSIKNKILPLGDSTKVYPGHGPESTIEFEKRMNPYLQ